MCGFVSDLIQQKDPEEVLSLWKIEAHHHLKNKVYYNKREMMVSDRI